MTKVNRFALPAGTEALLLNHGVDAEVVLRKAHMPADLLARDNVLLTRDEVMRVWKAFVEECDVENIAVVLGQSMVDAPFHPLLFASRCSPNLEVAAKRLADFKRILGPCTFTIAYDGEDLQVISKIDDGKEFMPTDIIATDFVFLTHMARTSTRKNVRPLRVELDIIPDHVQALEAFLGVPVHKAEACRIVFSKEDYKLPFLEADERLWRVFEQDFKGRLAEATGAESLDERLESVLLELLPAGIANVDEAANRLAMSRRTLQRKLKEDGKTFNQLLSATRAKLTKHYLKQGTLSKTEIAFLLGFSDPNSFFRAYKSWDLDDGLMFA